MSDERLRRVEELEASHDDLVDWTARLVAAVHVVTDDPEFNEPGPFTMTKGQKQILIAALAADQSEGHAKQGSEE